MEKQDLITIVESAITANGVKGISGDSLRNVLLEIVDAIYDGNSGGSGSASGGGNVVKVWLDQVFLGELSEEKRAENALAYTAIMSRNYDSVTAIADVVEGGENIYLSMPVNVMMSPSFEGAIMLIYLNPPTPSPEGVTLHGCLLQSDGTIMTV